jgi:hypothetical protein
MFQEWNSDSREESIWAKSEVDISSLLQCADEREAISYMCVANASIGKQWMLFRVEVPRHEGDFLVLYNSRCQMPRQP